MKLSNKIKDIFKKKVKIVKNKKSKFSDITIHIKINNENVQDIPLRILFNTNNIEYAPPAPPTFKSLSPAKYACIIKGAENYFSINQTNFDDVIDFNIYVQGEIGGSISYDIDTKYGFFVKGSKIINNNGYSELNFFFTKKIIKGCSKFRNSQGVLNYNYTENVSENYDKNIGPNDESCIPKGGITKNKILTMGDAIKIARYSVGLDTLSLEELLIANTNKNKVIDIGDALNISRAIAGLPSPLTK